MRAARRAVRARIRRIGATILAAGRELRHEPRMIRHLPEDILAAAFAPVRGQQTETSMTPTPPRVRDPARVAHRVARRGGPRREVGTAADLRVALVADDPLASWLSAACDAVLVRPEDWRHVLEGRLPHLLVVQDAQWGNAGAWQYRIAWAAHPDSLRLRDLSALAEWCADRGVPRVFLATRAGWEAALFQPAARLFDLVIAPDRLTAGRYGAEPTGHQAITAVEPTPADQAAAEELIVRIAATYGIVVASREASSLTMEGTDVRPSVSPDEP